MVRLLALRLWFFFFKMSIMAKNSYECQWLDSERKYYFNIFLKGKRCNKLADIVHNEWQKYKAGV